MLFLRGTNQLVVTAVGVRLMDTGRSHEDAARDARTCDRTRHSIARPAAQVLQTADRRGLGPDVPLDRLAPQLAYMRADPAAVN
jgi:hypothetical protein